MSSFDEKYAALSPRNKMKFDELAQDLNHAADKDRRHISTRFGYRHGGMAGAFGAILAVSALAILATMTLALLTPNMNLQDKLNLLDWTLLAPLPIILIIPFIYLKVRYALLMLLIVVIVLFFGMLVMGGLDNIFHSG